ncbi:hypothetical protein [Staphylococcus phage vB_SsapH-Golestan-105-M]|nr:hypothetical protein [Staphylococcus phage vB_SsapH-Golestan-105-M]
MANTVYQLEFINKLGTRRDNMVYSDLDNVIWSLKQEGFVEANEGENTYVRTEVIDNYVTEKIKTLVIIHKITHYKGRKLPKEDVYLKDPVYYRFLVFSYESYYPNGGTGDLKISFNTIEELKEDYEDLPFGLYEYIEVFDTKTGRTVNKSDYFPEVVEEVKEYLKNN